MLMMSLVTVSHVSAHLLVLLEGVMRFGILLYIWVKSSLTFFEFFNKKPKLTPRNVCFKLILCCASLDLPNFKHREQPFLLFLGLFTLERTHLLSRVVCMLGSSGTFRWIGVLKKPALDIMQNSSPLLFQFPYFV